MIITCIITIIITIIIITIITIIKADINAYTTSTGKTPLSMCAELGYMECVQELV